MPITEKTIEMLHQGSFQTNPPKAGAGPATDVRQDQHERVAPTHRLQSLLGPSRGPSQQTSTDRAAPASAAMSTTIAPAEQASVATDRRTELVMATMRSGGEVDSIARLSGVPPDTLRRWKDAFVDGGTRRLQQEP